MSAIYNIDDQSRIISVQWQGDAADGDLLAALKRYQIEIKSKPEYADYHELVNLEQMTGKSLSLSGLIKIAQLAFSIEPQGVKTKLALVVGSDFVFSLARMYQAYRTFSHQSNKTIKVFKNELKAIEWLRGKVSRQTTG